jgi:hypothetical protein
MQGETGKGRVLYRREIGVDRCGRMGQDDVSEMMFE